MRTVFPPATIFLPWAREGMGEPDTMMAVDAPIDPSGRLQEAVTAGSLTLYWVRSIYPPDSSTVATAGSEMRQEKVMAPEFADPATPKSAIISFASARNSE
jgi:hypothetical protein